MRNIFILLFLIYLMTFLFPQSGFGKNNEVYECVKYDRVTYTCQNWEKQHD